MPSSNLAARFEPATPDVLSEPPRAALQLVSSTDTSLTRTLRPRLSLDFRTIVTRDQGLRSFRVF